MNSWDVSNLIVCLILRLLHVSDLIDVLIAIPISDLIDVS